MSDITSRNQKYKNMNPQSLQSSLVQWFSITKPYTTTHFLGVAAMTQTFTGTIFTTAVTYDKNDAKTLQNVTVTRNSCFTRLLVLNICNFHHICDTDVL